MVPDLDIRKKYISMGNPAKAALWFTICNFLVKGISFIAIPIFTFLMSAEEYGLSALYMSYQEIILILATWELYIGAYQRGLYKFKEKQDSFTVSTILFINLLTLSCLALTFVFHASLVSITKVPAEIWTVFYIYYFFFPAYNCWMVRKRKSYEYKPVVAATLIYSLISAVFPAMALLLLAPTAVVKITFTLLPAAAFCAFFYFRSFRISHIKELVCNLKQQWSFLIRYQSPLIMHSLAYYVLNQADIIMISYLIGDAETAYYSVAYSLAMAISLFQNSINQSLIPWRYEMLENKMYDRIKSTASSLLALIGSVVIAFIMLAPDIITLLFDPGYQLAIWCIPPIALSAYFIFLYSIFVNVETYYEATQYVMYVSVACAILNICLNYIGIHFLGFTGCAYATLLSYVAFAIGHYYFMKLTLKRKRIDSQLVDPRMILLMSAGFVLAMVAALFVYPFSAARYVLLAVFIVIAFINRERIKQILSGIKDIR